MIKKLKKKIFWILMLSVSILITGIIILFAYMNYSSAISTAISIMERVNDFDKIQENIEPHEDMSDIDLDLNSETRMRLENKPPRGNIELDTNLDNTYYYFIEDGNIVNQSEDENDEIEVYALKAYNKNNESGIVGNYIYKTEKGMNNGKIVMLMENESVITRIRIIYIISIIACVILIFVTYIVSKKISNIIVKPVEETIEKQKQFISDASHELKTPLAVIEANVDVLEGQVGPSKWMEYIQSEISSMDKLINNLLFLAKTENTEHIKSDELFNVSEEITITTSMFESMAYDKKVKINYKITDNIQMKGYKEDIRQVVSTLLENAIMHTKEDGNIFVELNKEKNNIVIQIKNEGEPIPEDEKDKIFERFYRVDKSRNREEKRYGLGLAIAKSIVEQYKGKIDVNCQNGVTCFKVII